MNYITKQIIEKLTKSRHTLYPMYYLTADEIEHIVRVLNNHEMYKKQDKYYTRWCKEWRTTKWNKQSQKENRG